MSKKFSFDEVKTILFSYGYFLKSKEYKDIKSPIEMSDSLKYRYCLTFDSFLSNVRQSKGSVILDKFNTTNKFSIKNIVNWIKLECPEKIKFVSGIYEGARVQNLIFKCLGCGENFICCWNEIKGGKLSCNKCSRKRIDNSRRLDSSVLYDEILKLGFRILRIEEYKSVEINMDTECLKCGNVWRVKVSNLKTGYGCPRCRTSKGEKRVLKFLMEHNIKTVEQKTFDGCVYKSNLFFDFYLPDKNICIEYNGEQHYREVDFSYYNKNKEKSKKNFIIQKKRDKIKAKYCKENDIPLLIIPYTEFERIEEIITSFLKI